LACTTRSGLRHLLEELEVVERDRTTAASGNRVLIVADGTSLIGGEELCRRLLAVAAGSFYLCHIVNLQVNF
jgi:hypothetical protein